MNLLNSVKKLFGKPETPRRPIQPLTPDGPDAEELIVPEVTPAALKAEFAGGATPLLLDVRELYEWKQVRIPGAKHIPMGEIPTRLAEIDKERPVVVFCAHGGRSFGVTHFLLENHYNARNLAGGITQWHVQGGTVEVKTGY